MKKFKDLGCILLVDDDNLTNYIHSKAIERSDIDVHVHATQSAKEALEFLKHADNSSVSDGVPRPGIIFLDVNMPGMNGWDFMEEYRLLTAEQKARIVVVMLTTSLNPEDESRALSNKDIIRFMNKPLKPEMINEIASQFFEVDNSED